MTATSPPVDDASAEDPAEEPAGELVSVGAPMTETIRKCGGRTVTLHVIGGMQVSGVITELDADDGIVTIVDQGKHQVVALHAIAVLVTGGPPK